MTALSSLALTPLDLPGGPADAAEHLGEAHGFLEPLLGLGVVALIVAALVVLSLLLRRRGLLPTVALPTVLRPPSRPEDVARHILAERFAHGDLSAEEFMERASALNWTPGVADVGPRPLGRA